MLDHGLAQIKAIPPLMQQLQLQVMKNETCLFDMQRENQALRRRIQVFEEASSKEADLPTLSAEQFATHLEHLSALKQYCDLNFCSQKQLRDSLDEISGQVAQNSKQFEKIDKIQLKLQDHGKSIRHVETKSRDAQGLLDKLRLDVEHLQVGLTDRVTFDMFNEEQANLK